MQDQVNASPTPKRVPWNKGKLTGAKPPLRPKQVWSIRTKLQIDGRARDLAMFNLAIDSKLRGCDVVAIRVEDVAAGGYTADRATVRQKKTGRPVRFELSEQTPCPAFVTLPWRLFLLERLAPWRACRDRACSHARRALPRPAFEA